MEIYIDGSKIGVSRMLHNTQQRQTTNKKLPYKTSICSVEESAIELTLDIIENSENKLLSLY